MIPFADYKVVTIEKICHPRSWRRNCPPWWQYWICEVSYDYYRKQNIDLNKNAVRKTATFLFVLLISFVLIFLLLSPFASGSTFVSFVIFISPFFIAYFSVRFLEKRRLTSALKKQEEDISSREEYLKSLDEKCKTEESKLKALQVEYLKVYTQLKEAEARHNNLIANNSEYTMFKIDSMDGHAFEHWCADILSKNGFCNVEVTPGSGDHGVDVLAEKEGIRYAIQCKCYSHDLGNTPVQEVYAGKEMYCCQVGVVMTNRYFTSGAKTLAEQTRVLLWDRDKLRSLIGSAEK